MIAAVSTNPPMHMQVRLALPTHGPSMVARACALIQDLLEMVCYVGSSVEVKT